MTKRHKVLWLRGPEMAARLGVTVRQLSNLQELGLPTNGEKGQAKRFPALVAEGWYAKFKRREAEARGRRGKGLTAARIRKLKVEARLRELELKRRRGELVPMDDVEQMLRRPLEEVAAAIRRVPEAHAEQLAKLAGVKRTDAARMLRQIVDSLFADLRALTTTLDQDEPEDA